MNLFQQSVLNNYLKSLDQNLINKKWEQYKLFFLNPLIQQNIRNSKEEQYQGEFIIDLFEKILGYIKHPSSEFNIITELKNVKGSKKADAAIISEGKAIAVIELKGTNTTDLGKVESQAFGYKNNQPGCTYVIISNFEKLRFYIDNAVDFEEFNLFELTEERFRILWICLSADYLLKNRPKQIKNESLTQEENITKKLYHDYSLFRQQIFESIQRNNPHYNKLVLFKKTQKLLDRFLFIFFAEDRLLLPPNSIRSILKQWTELKEKYDEYQPLYNRFKKYFGYLNTGYKGQKHEIFAYNGGLFTPDDILEKIEIDDQLLYDHVLTLSNYDFQSEISVNILGHIFENSLNEIEEIQNELSDVVIDQGRSRRNKEGVFYTPKYVTKYIVDNTLGQLCEEKKIELDFQDSEFEKERKGRKKSTLKKLKHKLTDYRNWLLKITICDPACGSGAFLNQALEFLIAEHKYLDELNAKVFGDALVLSEIENSILEHNIFGVDINEESVEIAKLSLWLRTAQKGRKLTSLSKNIKCGNSLINDPNIAGERAFNWQVEFPDVFNNGGFDIIIGNPPYVNVELMPQIDKEFYRKNYKSFYKRSDLFSLFIELATKELTTEGKISFIIPSIVLNNLSYKITRENLLSNEWLSLVCYTGNSVFKDATVDTIILVIDKAKNHKEITLVNAIDFFNQQIQKVELSYFSKYNNNISISQSEANTITDKIFKSEFVVAGDHFQIFQGVVTGNNEAFIFEDKEEARKKGIEIQLLKTMCHGRDISKWRIEESRELLYLNSGMDLEEYPSTQLWLEKFKDKLSSRRECENGVIPWYSLQWPRDKKSFEKVPKILIQNTRNERLQPRIIATIDETGLFGTQGLNFIISNSKYDIYSFLGLLNSKLINYLFSTKFLNLAIKADYLKQLKFPPQMDKCEIRNSTLEIGKLHKTLNEITNSFLELLVQKYSIEKISNKLQVWHELDFAQFLKELYKKKIKMTLQEEAEWMQYFKEQKDRAQILKSKIYKLESSNDYKIYELYNLTGEEIKLIEETVL